MGWLFDIRCTIVAVKRRSREFRGIGIAAIYEILVRFSLKNNTSSLSSRTV